MEVVIRQHEQQCGVTAADIVADAVVSGATTLGLATGSSPLSVYRDLIRRHRADWTQLPAVQAFLLDEYVGLPPSHPQSYAHVIRAEFTDHVDIDSGRVHSPNGVADDIFVAATEYDALIADVGPVDVQLLGIGAQRAHRVQRAGVVTGVTHPGQDPDRADPTRQRPVLHGVDEVPRHVITQGLGTICDARHLVLIATGSHKAEAVAAAVEGPLTASCPASVLQLHPHVTVVVDEAAAAHLKNADFYRYALKYKPAQQKY